MLTSRNYKQFYCNDESDKSLQEYWDSGKGAVGCIFLAKSDINGNPSGKILIGLRSKYVDEPGEWGTFGGKIDDEDEHPAEALKREIKEELNIDIDKNCEIKHIWTFEDESENFTYENYLVIVPTEFTPRLNWENSEVKWVKYGNWPGKLHFGLNALIKNAGHKIKHEILSSKNTQSNMSETIDAPPAVVQPNTISNQNRVLDQQALTNAYVVIATLWKEARGEGEEGVHAVLNVIMNRAKGDFSKAKDVVLKPKQFSAWNKSPQPEEESIQLAREMRGDKTYDMIVALVDTAMKGNLKDITGGATFYINPKKANPSWIKKLTKTITIGNHDFYKITPVKSTKTTKKTVKENTVITKQGLVDDGITGYEMKSTYSHIRFGHEESTNTFYLYTIGTVPEQRNKGYAKELLIKLFQLIKTRNGVLNVGTYTGSGLRYIQPLVNRFSKDYHVRLVSDRI